MSRMKHILRRLHIGGGRPNDQSAEEARPNNSAVTDPNPSPPLFSSSPSSDMDPSSTPSPSTIARNRDVAADAPSDSSCFDSNFFEEEFQVQLALAISASDPGASLDVAETAQIKAAERISLISSTPSVPKCETLVEFLSLQYWNYNFINYDEKVVDGFYDVYGNSTNLVSQGKMPSLADLQATSLVDDVGYEVIMVDRSVDVDLQMLDSRACCLLMESQASTQDPVISGLIQKIADLVVGRMGGPVVDAEEMNKRWIARSYELRKSLNTVILPLGYLDIGLSRHRAMLFKALADKINLPCMLVKGFYYTGTDEGAVNLIKAENGSEYIIDLMGAPGALIPAEVPTGHLQNFRSDVQSSAGTTKKDKNSCLELVRGSRTSVASPHLDNVPKVGSSELNYVGIQFKKADDCEVQKDRKERFEHDFGKLLPSLHMSCECSIPAGGESSHAQKMQVIDVSKYVISAAKNPEFAQKLHAVLLESGAIPPNLSIDINSHPKMLEQNPFVEEQKVNDGVQCPVNESVLNDNLLSNPSLPSKTTSEGYVLVGHEATGSAVGDVGQHFQENAGINPVLGEVAEWEIPWEDLQIGERIGIGSYGEVYRADWNGTEVAVKKFLNQDFSGEALIQFIYEVELMIKLRHPNVVLFMGAVTRSPNSSILTEFLPRGSLYKLLHRTHIRINERRRVRMALDVAKGMNYLHTGHPPIVHRDLKSPNLLVDKNWVVKVCDFGLSRWKHNTFLSSKSTAGTAEWMAPEVLRNEPSNEKCDVYSFGVILWELTTLRVPWSGMNPMQVVGAVGFQNKRLEIPKEVDPMVAQIILDCWQTEPQLRPSFSQLISRLRLVQRLTVE